MGMTMEDLIREGFTLTVVAFVQMNSTYSTFT